MRNRPYELRFFFAGLCRFCVAPRSMQIGKTMEMGGREGGTEGEGEGGAPKKGGARGLF